MSKVGQKEIFTQKHVIQFFKNELGYDYLGDWQDREGNSNVEELMLKDQLKRQGHDEKVISKVMRELGKARAVGGHGFGLGLNEGNAHGH